MSQLAETRNYCAPRSGPLVTLRHARWPGPVAFAVIATVLFACYLRLSWTAAASPDGASAALRAQSMLDGNVLLHGWTLTDVSFFTTELPEYALIEAVRGLNENTIHLAAAVTYTTLILLAAWLAKGNARGGQGIARMLITAGIMLAPQSGDGVRLLLSQPDHLGTAIPVLGCFLLADRRPRHHTTPVLVTVLLALAIIGDRLAILDAALPLACAGGIRAYRTTVRDRKPGTAPLPDLSLIAASLGAVLLAEATAVMLRRLGGYTSLPLVNRLTGSAQMPAHLWATVEGILNLFGADFFQMHFTARLALVLVHLAGVGLAGWALCRGLRQMLRTDDILIPVLVSAITLNLLAYAFSIVPLAWYDAREIAPVLPLGAVLAGRLLDRPLAAARLYPILACALGGYVLALVSGMSQPARFSTEHSLAGWLQAHHLTSGLGTYTEDNLATVTSGGRVTLRTVTWTAHGAVPRLYESDISWYDARHHYANFVITNTADGLASRIPRQDILALAGPPAHVYHYKTFTIMVWNTNLLSRLGSHPSNNPGNLPHSAHPDYQN